MTHILQNLGSIINKSFKDLIYVEYLISINCDNAKISNDKNLDWIVDIQWNKGQISSTMIKISFRIIGLPNKNYG